MNKYSLFLFALFLSRSVMAYELGDNLKIHGFFTQNAIHTSDNNMYGDSEDSVSTEFTEAAVNFFYSPLEKLSFSFQGLYRNAGEVDHDTLDVDYAFADFNFEEYEQGEYGLRLGRIKNPVGLYNETRDVAFTTPSIILPQGIYFDRSRSLLLSADGAQLYLQHRLNEDNISFKINYGKPRNENDELLKAIIPYPTSKIPVSPLGDLESSGSHPAIIGQISYEKNAGEMIFAFSFADVSLSYDPKAGDPFLAGSTDFRLYLLSVQYNGEKLNLTGEYKYQENDFKDFGQFYPDTDPVSESWYLQLGYRFRYNWQLYLRYDEAYSNKDDRSGKESSIIGTPAHQSFAKDAMFGLRWDINPSIMLRAEYHNVNGTSWLTSADNPDRTKTERYWDLFALQFSVRF